MPYNHKENIKELAQQLGIDDAFDYTFNDPFEVVEKYFLKFVPASRLRNLSDGKENFGFRVDLYSKEEDMVKHGWKLFESLQEMNEAADIENQPESIRNFIVRPRYELSEG